MKGPCVKECVGEDKRQHPPGPVLRVQLRKEASQRSAVDMDLENRASQEETASVLLVHKLHTPSPCNHFNTLSTPQHSRLALPLASNPRVCDRWDQKAHLVYAQSIQELVASLDPFLVRPESWGVHG